MKKIAALLLVIIFNLKFTKAQTTQTIESIEVSYKSVPGTTVNAGMGFKAVPQATINLIESVEFSKIHLKIINPDDNTVIYQVSYIKSSTPVTSSGGVKLFEVSGNSVYINTNEVVLLRPYLYEVKTENAQGVFSSAFVGTR